MGCSCLGDGSVTLRQPVSFSNSSNGHCSPVAVALRSRLHSSKTRTAQDVAFFVLLGTTPLQMVPIFPEKRERCAETRRSRTHMSSTHDEEAPQKLLCVQRSSLQKSARCTRNIPCQHQQYLQCGCWYSVCSVRGTFHLMASQATRRSCTSDLMWRGMTPTAIRGVTI